MNWGTELWDQYDNLACYTNKTIDFLDVFASFVRQRCALELEYASKIRRLTKSYFPKKSGKDDEFYQFTYAKAFLTLLNESNDIAGQHEMIAESLTANITNSLGEVVKNLKEQRKKCLVDGSKLNLRLLEQEESLNKSKKLYEKQFKEAVKSQIQFERADADMNLSRVEIEKRRSTAHYKSRLSDDAKANYATRLKEFNETKKAHFYAHLPAVLVRLQELESERIQTYGQFIRTYVQCSTSVIPIINTCYTNMEMASQSIDPEYDNKLVIEKFKSGFVVPDDEEFIDLSQLTQYSFNTNSSPQQQLNNQESLQNGHCVPIHPNNISDMGTKFNNNNPNTIPSLPPTQIASKIILGISDKNNVFTPTLSTKSSLLNTNTSGANQNRNMMANGFNSSNGRTSHNSNESNINQIDQADGGSSHSQNNSSNNIPATLLNNGGVVIGGKKRNILRQFLSNVTLGASSRVKDDFSELPPNQRRKKIMARIDHFNTQLGQEKASRDAMLRMREVYEQNPRMGDANTITSQLDENAQRINKLTVDIERFQNLLHDIERTMPRTNTLNNANYHFENGNNIVNHNQINHKNGNQNTPYNENSNLNGLRNMAGGGQQHSNPNTILSGTSSSVSCSSIVNGINSHPGSSTEEISAMTKNLSLNRSINNNKVGDYDLIDDNCRKYFGGKNVDDGQNMDSPAAFNHKTNCAKPPGNPNNTNNSLDETTSSISEYYFETSGANNTVEQLSQNIINHLSSPNNHINTTNKSTLQNCEQTPERDSNLNGNNIDEEGILTVIGFCVALYDFDGSSEGSIPMKVGEKFDLLELDQGDGWTRVKTTGNKVCSEDVQGDRISFIEGFIPTSYVQITMLENN